MLTYKYIGSYHIFGRPFCKMAAIKVIEMFCVGLLCFKIFYILSVPLKMYIFKYKNILISGGLEAEILARVYRLGRLFRTMATTGVSRMFFPSLKHIFVTSDCQNIPLDIDIQNICELEGDIKL